LESYANQPGAPLLEVRSSCSDGKSSIDLTQKRFIGSPGAAPASPQTWTIPVCFKAGGEPRCEIIASPMQTAEADRCGNVFANADGRGYYVTEYAPDAVRGLATSANGLKPVERISLLGDEWWMIRAG